MKMSTVRTVKDIYLPKRHWRSALYIFQLQKRIVSTETIRGQLQKLVSIKIQAIKFVLLRVNYKSSSTANLISFPDSFFHDYYLKNSICFYF